jgi:hypothetical protein
MAMGRVRDGFMMFFGIIGGMIDQAFDIAKCNEIPCRLRQNLSESIQIALINFAHLEKISVKQHSVAQHHTYP